MEKDEWLKVVKWMGYAYLPIALLIIGIFMLIQWNSNKVQSLQRESGSPSATSTHPR